MPAGYAGVKRHHADQYELTAPRRHPELRERFQAVSENNLRRGLKLFPPASVRATMVGMRSVGKSGFEPSARERTARARVDQVQSRFAGVWMKPRLCVGLIRISFMQTLGGMFATKAMVRPRSSGCS